MTNTGEQNAILEATTHAALKRCQERYDAQLPPEVSEAGAEQQYLMPTGESLAKGYIDVTHNQNC